MKYLPIILLLTGCLPEIEPIAIPVQITPYVCVDGYQWSLQSEPIVNEFGAQLTCANNAS